MENILTAKSLSLSFPKTASMSKERGMGLAFALTVSEGQHRDLFPDFFADTLNKYLKLSPSVGDVIFWNHLGVAPVYFQQSS